MAKHFMVSDKVLTQNLVIEGQFTLITADELVKHGKFYVCKGGKEFYHAEVRRVSGGLWRVAPNFLDMSEAAYHKLISVLTAKLLKEPVPCRYRAS